MHPRDRWIARGLSLALHALLLLWIGLGFQAGPAGHMVVFSVETVSGITPLGEGSGAPGASAQMDNTPANANPLAGGLHLNVTRPAGARGRQGPRQGRRPGPSPWRPRPACRT